MLQMSRTAIIIIFGTTEEAHQMLEFQGIERQRKEDATKKHSSVFRRCAPTRNRGSPVVGHVGIRGRMGRRAETFVAALQLRPTNQQRTWKIRLQVATWIPTIPDVG